MNKRRQWWIVAISVAIVGWLTADVLVNGWWVHVDQQASNFIRDLNLRHSPWPKIGIYLFTQFGARGTILAVFIPFVAVVSWQRRTWQPLIRLVVALSLLTLTVYAFKFGVGRTAPVVNQIHAGGQSFPSGHVPNAVLMWWVAAWIARDYRLPTRLCQWLDILRFAAPVMTALAMLALDYHWLSDLVAGFALGAILLTSTRLICARLAVEKAHAVAIGNTNIVSDGAARVSVSSVGGERSAD